MHAFAVRAWSAAAPCRNASANPRPIGAARPACRKALRFMICFRQCWGWTNDLMVQSPPYFRNCQSHLSKFVFGLDHIHYLNRESRSATIGQLNQTKTCGYEPKIPVACSPKNYSRGREYEGSLAP